MLKTAVKRFLSGSSVAVACYLGVAVVLMCVCLTSYDQYLERNSMRDGLNQCSRQLLEVRDEITKLRIQCVKDQLKDSVILLACMKKILK